MNEPPGATSRLVSCVWLAEHLDDPSVRVIEVSASPDDAAYHEGHIPGALWWFWKDALWHQTDREFATPEELAQRLGSIGISHDTTIVLCGNPVQFGTYAFWVLTLGGHRDVRMLDGARTRWIKEDRPLSSDAPIFPPVDYLPGTAVHNRAGWVATTFVPISANQDAFFWTFAHQKNIAGRGLAHLLCSGSIMARNEADAFQVPYISTSGIS